ncbi:MAG: hypothetical protein LBR83_02805 [Clostridiales bacterium]|jgi:hypothetical protein|nr:hypothetical protein [Clostridiales bacterium]
MSVETRHTEKSILYKLLTIEDMDDLDDIIYNLIATMEPEDVELVKKQVAERKTKKKS